MIRFNPADDEEDKGTVKWRLGTVVREPDMLSMISPVAICRKHHNRSLKTMVTFEGSDLNIEYFSYPDGDPKADQGKARLDAEKSFYNKGLGFGDVVVAYGEQDDDGRDEGEDVGGDDDGAPCD